MHKVSLLVGCCEVGRWGGSEDDDDDGWLKMMKRRGILKHFSGRDGRASVISCDVSGRPESQPSGKRE